MRILSNIVGVLLLVSGCIWFLQGVSVLPGSIMTGQMKWAIIGGTCIVAGILLLFSANRAKP